MLQGAAAAEESMAEARLKELKAASLARAQGKSDKALADVKARKAAEAKEEAEAQGKGKGRLTKAQREAALRELEPRATLKPSGDDLARAAVMGKGREVDEMQAAASRALQDTTAAV